MIVVKIIGGLGNQMFQYAFAKALEQKGNKVKIDVSGFKNYKLHGGYQLDSFSIDLEKTNKTENLKFKIKHLFFKIFTKIGYNYSKKINEKSLLFDKSLLEIENRSYVEGYFQCEKYFKSIRKLLLNQFIDKSNYSDYLNKIKSKIISSKNTTSLHIRRGDFVNDTNMKIHGICDLLYYEKAVDKLENIIGPATYFIFSDDINWCKKNLKLANVHFIENNGKGTPHQDMHLMSLCNHNIIANSSFSWWGAWLNKNQNKIVIAPKKWFADEKLQKQSKSIVCDNWIKV